MLTYYLCAGQTLRTVLQDNFSSIFQQRNRVFPLIANQHQHQHKGQISANRKSANLKFGSINGGLVVLACCVMDFMNHIL
jgi:hypothetical protein